MNRSTPLDRVETEHGRFYRSPSGLLLPSVTTILSATVPEADQARLDRWRERATPKELAEAEEHGLEGTERGSRIHKRIEDWANDPFSDGPVNDPADPWWNSLVPFLRTVEQPILLEAPVWSSAGFAGTLDMLAMVRPGLVALIDWKTARKKKARKWRRAYELQVAAYARAVFEVYDVKVEIGAVVIAYEGEPADILWLGEADLRKAWAEFQRRLRSFDWRGRCSG